MRNAFEKRQVRTRTSEQANVILLARTSAGIGIASQASPTPVRTVSLTGLKVSRQTQLGRW